jgi:adenosylhomocysteine nucleosidase
MDTWLLVAAERRELDGILKRVGRFSKLHLPVDFACECGFADRRWFMIANGPGRALVEAAMEIPIEVNGIVSTGFCGALDPALRVGDIVQNGIVCSDRVAVTAVEKAYLRERTGAAAVDMESAAVRRKAEEWGVPFRSVRAVSDVAGDDLPLDFNLYRDAHGRFSRGRIAMAAVSRPFRTIPGLLRLERNCRIAAEALGAYLVDSRL